jgi:hypothetical protein
MRRHLPMALGGTAALAAALAGWAGHPQFRANADSLISSSPVSASSAFSPSLSPSLNGRPADRPPVLLTAVQVPARSPSFTDSPSSVNSPVPTAEQLQSALLTLANLPSATGFQELPPIDLGSGDANVLSGCPYATEDQATPSADVSATFGDSLIGPEILTEDLQQYPVSVAEAQLRQFADAASKCSTFSTLLDHFNVAISLTPEAFPSYGDGTVALSLTGEVLIVHLSTTSDLVAVRDGGTVMVITYTSATPALEYAFTRTVVATAYRKLAALEQPSPCKHCLLRTPIDVRG